VSTQPPEAAAAAEPIIDLLAIEWRSIDDLCTVLSADEWERPTDCPGWSVKDQVAHLIGTESALAGEPSPPPPPSLADAGHVHNEIGRSNEAWVASLRATPPGRVLGRFREITTVRLEQLRASSREDFDALGPSPVGRVPYREFMSVRLMDNWVHEQDIRRAVARGGHRQGPVVDGVLARFVGAMPFVVGKKVGAANGSSVVFDLDGETRLRFAVVVDEGRASIAEPPERATATLHLGTETWWCLALGRGHGADVTASGGVSIDGDDELAHRVIDNLAFMI